MGVKNQKILLVVFISLFSFFNISSGHALIDQEVRNKIDDLQDIPNSIQLPGGADPRGMVGEILANIFDGGWYIKSVFIRALENAATFANGEVLMWDSSGSFVPSSISESGSDVMIDNNLTVSGSITGQDLNISGTTNLNDTVSIGGFNIDPSSSWPGAFWAASAGGIYHNAGRVGIGTDTPQNSLHSTSVGRFDGGIQVDDIIALSSNNAYHVAQPFTDTGHYGTFMVRNHAGDLGASFGYGNGNDKVDIFLGDTDNLIIDGNSSIQVGIGTDSPTQMLDVAGNARATAFLYSSDERLKENIAPLEQNDIVSSIQAVRYDWRDSGESDIGVIAQDVQNVYPEAVNIGNDGYLSVDYAKLVVPLLQKVQELEHRIQQLENQ